MQKANSRYTFATLISVAFLVVGVALYIGLFPTRAYAASVSEIAVGDHIHMGKQNPNGYSGLPYWRVLDKDAQGNLLLMSEYLWLGDGENPTELISFNPKPPAWDACPLLPEYEAEGYQDGGSGWQGSLAQAWCAAFEQEVLSNVAGLTIKPTTKSDAEFQSPDISPIDQEVITFAKRTNILKNDRVFFLSAEEVAHYMPTKAQRSARPYGWGNRPNDPPAWWLRSPRLIAKSECAGKVYSIADLDGAIKRTPVYYPGAARPAMWVTLAPNTVAAKCGKAGSAEWAIGTTKIPHIFGEASYTWSSGNTSCTAKTICASCNEVLTETVKTTAITQGTTTTYTATFTNTEYFTTQTKKINRTPVTTKMTLKSATAPAQKYTGKALKPAVTVKDANGKTVPASAYTVTYANNKYPGTATATVKAKADSKYTGTVQATFKITAAEQGVYWLVNKKTGENLYTTAVKEVNTLSKVKKTWTNKGLMWYAPTVGDPIYRLVNKKTGDHHFTKSANEVRVLTKVKKTWTADFNGKPIFYSGGPKKVWRQYSDARQKAGKPGTHKFTTYNAKLKGWKNEGALVEALRYGKVNGVA